MTLPAGTTPDSIIATMSKGVLTVKVTKPTAKIAQKNEVKRRA
jgi:HSP20 family molecular chaperone IbpA